MKKINDCGSKWIGVILVLGFLIRVAFLLFGAKIMYPDNIYWFGDTKSYVYSFINLWEHGTYAIWLDNPDSYMGRGPGYPFFWGLHYIIFGAKYAYIAVAVSQILLDILAIKFVFDIVKKLAKNVVTPFIAAFLYAAYPFVIVWLTITGTEAFANFLIILTLWVYYTRTDSYKKYVLLGFLIAYATLTRPYLGLFLPFVVLADFAQGKKFFLLFKQGFVLSLVFVMVYGLWPLRNYVNHDKFVIFNSPASGYYNFQKDFNSFRSWVYSWEPYSDLINEYRIQITKDTSRLIVPEKVFISQAEREKFDSLIHLCRTCGSSFYYWKYYRPYQGVDCNDEIAMGFNELKESFISRNKFYYHVEIPVITFLRSIFKFSTAENSSLFNSFLLFYRTITLVLGFIGAFYFVLKDRRMFLLLLYPLFWYFYLSIGHSQFEIRYLLQADVILMLIGILFVEKLFKKKINV
ncbi:MAG: hypothetical protein PHY85_05200 [Bacteroidales bacterium]|nr:hypothetical protein [Bacteroidales bacterium]